MYIKSDEMAQKNTRKSKYAANDENFVYSPLSCYMYDDFAKLSVTKIQSIARSLMVPNISNTNKDKLIQAIVHKHNERRSRAIAASEEKKEEGTVEEVEPMSTNDRTVIDALNFTEQLKDKFHQIRHYILNGKLWFEGNSIASFLEYEIPQKAVCDHVEKEDKIKFHQIHENSRNNIHQH